MRIFLAGLVAAAAFTLGVPAAHAATFDVDKPADDAGGGACTVAADDCSLRSAIMLANVDPDADTVQLPAGTHTLVSDLTPVAGDTTIAGAGARLTAIDGAGVAQPLFLDGTPTTQWTVQDLTVRGAAAPATDIYGAIDAHNGTLTVRRVAVVDNALGGILTDAIATVEDSLVARNTGPVFGGVLGVQLLTLRNTTVTQNTATLPAASPVPFVYGPGVVTGCAGSIVNSTIADNTSAPGTASIGGDNIGNFAYFGFGCLFSSGRLRNTIVSGGGETGNCSGGATSLGGNVDSDGTCQLGLSTDRTETDPLLAPLADNGGPTDTRALLPGSPALGIGKSCGAADQRGVPRPQGGACDAGAYESELVAPLPPAPPAPPTVTVTGPTVTVPAPTVPADTKAAKLTLTGLPKTVKRAALAKGLKLTVSSDEVVSISATLGVAPRRVTIARSYDLTIATVVLPRATGRRTLTIRTKKKLAGTRAVRAQLRILAIDGGGNRTLVTRTFTIT